MFQVLRLICVLSFCLFLAACLDTLEGTLENAEIEAQGQAVPPEEVIADVEPIEAPPNVRAIPAVSLTRLGFTPIADIPAQTEQKISEALRRAAFLRNMFLVPNGDQTQSHIVKGYLSLTNNELGTIIVYVWDIQVIDGTASHRVTGQILAPFADGTWSTIDQRTIDTLAVQSMEALIVWLNGQLSVQQDTRDIVPFR